MKQNKYYSYNIKQLPIGCQYCVRGEKLVIFVTGICPRKCTFCPVSDQKFQLDVSFANERKIDTFSDIIKEAKLMKAKGAGITGGDPLSKLDRTIEYIQRLKQEFGEQFHVHLYTSLNLVSIESLSKLHQAGLDEIRFHLDLDDNKFWERLELARGFDWGVGVEVPLILGREEKMKKLIDFVKDRIDFLNMNELEIADNEHSSLKAETVGISYAVKGSLELGLEMLDYIKEQRLDLTVHLCTAKLKDAVQLASRIKREAKGAKHSFDIVDKEGMLTRGALYLDDLKPGFAYREKLNNIDKQDYVDKLKPLLQRIKSKMKNENFFLDLDKPRILLSKKIVKKKKSFFHKLGLKPAIVKEYPTADQLEIEVEFL